MFIQTEPTSEPDTLKFLPGRSVLEGKGVSFADEEAAQRSPLAARLFQLESVTGVSLGSDYVAVGKAAEADWQLLKPAIFGIIMEHFLANKPVLLDDGDALAAEIRDLIETRIRPGIAAEGGDIRFHEVRDGVVRLELVDNGLATPVFTLQIRAENTLRYYLPEIAAVEFTRPAAPAPRAGLDLDDPETAAVKALLDERVNPAVAAHGGFIALIEVKDHTVYLSLEGGCQGCGMADVTLKQGVETMIRDELPSITAVLDVTDHAGGANPYYEPDKAGVSPF